MSFFNFSLALLLLAAIAAAQPISKNPCHGVRGDNTKVTCQKVKLPPKLCTACVLKPPRDDGNFVNCKSIYDLDDSKCQEQLRKYAFNNAHCDPVRMAMVNNINSPWGREGLDYFVYSVCEECCDCVPRGSEASQYDQRKKDKTLLSSTRGNCPAHAVYDICAVWPQVKFVSPPGNKKKFPDEFNRPLVCPLLREWLASDDGKGWLLKDFVKIDGNIDHFLKRFLSVAKCGKRKTWLNCRELEAKQERL